MSDRKARILLYSDDRTVREAVRLSLGRSVARDVPDLEIWDVATMAALIAAVDAGDVDLMILDGEATPAGGIGMCKQLKDEVPNCPPVVLLVARVADAWLATWSRADAISPFPIDPVRLPEAVASLLRARFVEV